MQRPAGISGAPSASFHSLDPSRQPRRRHVHAEALQRKRQKSQNSHSQPHTHPDRKNPYARRRNPSAKSPSSDGNPRRRFSGSSSKTKPIQTSPKRYAPIRGGSATGTIRQAAPATIKIISARRETCHGLPGSGGRIA